MKPILITLSVFVHSLIFGQTASFKTANHWKIYNATTGNLFQYPIDTLKIIPYYSLDDDSMHGYLAEVVELPSDDPPRWMGVHIATYEMGRIIHKIEISLYGGFLYDETTKKHYQLPENKIDGWLSYIRRSFMAIQKGTAGK